MDARLAMDPSVSGAQHRAMAAAAHGRSSLGISKKVGEEFLRADKGAAVAKDKVKLEDGEELDVSPERGAGIMLVTPDGRALFIRRAKGHPNEGTWDFPGGKRDGAETPEETAKREMLEEIGALPYGERALIYSHECDDGFVFDTFVQPIAFEFKPKLSPEHTDYEWAPVTEPPSPIHPGVADMLKHFGKDVRKGAKQALDSLAMDRDSVRTLDTDGRMHVAITHISKANVCPYKGSEIPGADELGLDQTRVYKLLRDPEELAKGASTFNNLPLLSEHVPVSAEAHRADLVVGSTGTDARFEAPYLDNSLVIWTADAIKGVETEEQYEISCAYHYDADMTPGTYEGERYDGVMRNIRGNHVALVAAGRAGPDVVVGDSMTIQPTWRTRMKRKTLSRQAIAVKGALLAFLAPKLAMDKMPDLDVMLAGVKRKTWTPETKKTIAEALKPVLAADADLDSVVQLLDRLDNAAPKEDPDEEIVPDAGPADQILELLRGKVDDQTLAQVAKCCEGMTAPPAADAEEEERKRLEAEKAAAASGQAKDTPPAFPGKPETGAKEKAEVKAMDQALERARKENEKATKIAVDAAVETAVQRVRSESRAIAEAEEAVRPYVGKIAIACDSAESVYKAALDVLKIDTKGVHPSAFRAILIAQPKPGQERSGSPRLVAQDGAISDEMRAEFPDLYRLNAA